MLGFYHYNYKGIYLQVIEERPEAALLKEPGTDHYYIDYSDGTDSVELLVSPDDFEALAYLHTMAILRKG